MSQFDDDKPMNTAESQAPGSTPERRFAMPPVPENLNGMLSNEQKIAMNQKLQFGWLVKFVRRPLFQPAEVVLSNPEGSEFLYLDADGTTRNYFNVRTDDLR